jgi:hypothetical protein
MGEDRGRAGRRIAAASGRLSSLALARLQRESWFVQLPADQRALVGVVLQAGITSFVGWYDDPRQHPWITAEVFGGAPRELTRSISLEQTVRMVRLAIDVVEEEVPTLVDAEDLPVVHEAVLRFSREVAFAAATVYARAAEDRGAWDARLEALVVDAVLRDDPDDQVLSHAAALGWHEDGGVRVVVGSLPSRDPETALEQVRRTARGLGRPVLAGLHGERLVLVAGATADGVPHRLVECFGPGPVVVGPPAAGLARTPASARAALAGLRAARGRATVPRPVDADDLLPERALLGDEDARARLVDEVYRPLLADGAVLRDTVAAYLDAACTVEAAARALVVHPNTVRYRLRRVHDVVGYAATDPRAVLTFWVAITLGRLADDGPA